MLLSICVAIAQNAEQADTLRPVHQEQLRAAADSAYLQHHYEEAYQSYTALAKAGIDPHLYYNIGNTCFKMKRYPEAILWYERALRFDPSDEDAQYNLSVCRSRAMVRADNGQQMFLVSCWHRTLASQSVDGWAYRVLFTLALSMLLLVCCRRLPRLWMRKMAAVLFCPAVMACIFCIVAAATTYHHFNHTTMAVVMRDTPVRNESGGSQISVLAAGYTLEVLDKSPSGQWLVENENISLKGWVNAQDLEEI